MGEVGVESSVGETGRPTSPVWNPNVNHREKGVGVQSGTPPGQPRRESETGLRSTKAYGSEGGTTL